MWKRWKPVRFRISWPCGKLTLAISVYLQSNSGSCPTDGSQPVIMRRGHGSVSEMPHSCLLLERSDATARWIVQVVFHSHIFQPMQVIATIFPCIMILNLYHEPICIDCTNQSLNFEEFSSVVWHLAGLLRQARASRSILLLGFSGPSRTVSSSTSWSGQRRITSKTWPGSTHCG